MMTSAFAGSRNRIGLVLMLSEIRDVSGNGQHETTRREVWKCVHRYHNQNVLS